VRVIQLAGFSAHADRNDLLDYANSVRDNKGLGRIALVHGEPEAQQSLISLLHAEGHANVINPAPLQKLEL